MFHGGRRGYVAFDLETTGLFDGDIPPAVVCAATMELLPSGNGDVRAWAPEDLDECTYYSATELEPLVDYLWARHEDGIYAVGWNSAGYDFRVLYAHLQAAGADDAVRRVRTMVWGHVDPMFNFFMAKGYPVSLKSVATAFKLPNKSGSGADVAELWKGGREERQGVIDYCCRDVVVTANVFATACDAQKVRWIARSGNANAWVPKDPTAVFATVAQAATLPHPDNSFMEKDGRTAPKIQNFIGWIQQLDFQPNANSTHAEAPCSVNGGD